MTPTEVYEAERVELERRNAELPGVQYIPSNSSDGSVFLDGICPTCARDRVMNGSVKDEAADPERDYCSILNASFRGEAVEWRKVDGRVLCTGYQPLGFRERCDKTAELF